ncbi:hypothetical protein ACFQL4_19830 [Halosimplex aquaticum]
MNAVVGKDLDVGGGYAAFRLANGCEDVTCGQVVARNCARGVFTVSASSNATINGVNIVGTTSHGILIQDGENVTVDGGLVKNTGAEGVRIDSRSSPNTRRRRGSPCRTCASSTTATTRRCPTRSASRKGLATVATPTTSA